MVNKKAQAQIITTILIILLVLAAIIIIWQVVSGTVREGAEEIESQSSCLGLRIDITNVVKGEAGIKGVGEVPDIPEVPGRITIRPTKKIAGYQIYVEGIEFGVAGGEALALTTPEIIGDRHLSIGQEIEVIPTIGDAVCPGTKQKVK